MTVQTYQLLRDDGFKAGPFRTNPLNREVTIRAALRVMVDEAGTPWSHTLEFRMDDGSRVVARAKFQPQQGA